MNKIQIVMKPVLCLSPKKRGREMPAPILGSNGLGETWSAFGTLALVRGDEESEPEAIEGD